MEIYAHARAFMRKTGNPGQWKDSYPAEALIREEIRRGVCYVCVQENEIEGVFSYLPGPDSTYQRIDGGKWLNEEPYGVVHRLAGRGRVRGVADCCLEWAVARCGNLRIDTHRDNLVMQHILEKICILWNYLRSGWKSENRLPEGAGRRSHRGCRGM